MVHALEVVEGCTLEKALHIYHMMDMVCEV